MTLSSPILQSRPNDSRQYSESDMAEANQDATFESIRTILEPYNAEGVEITASTRLTSDLNIDSVAAMDLIMEIEDRFEIDIPVNMVSEVETAQDLVQIVTARMEQRA